MLTIILKLSSVTCDKKTNLELVEIRNYIWVLRGWEKNSQLFLLFLRMKRLRFVTFSIA